MRPQSFLGLLVATLVAVAAAAVVFSTGEKARVDTAAGTPAFPSLQEETARVATLAVTARGGSFLLERGEAGRWVVADRGGYPADQAQVRQILQGLAKLTLYQPKTALPERLPRLWLDDPASPDGRGVRLTVRADAGDL